MKVILRPIKLLLLVPTLRVGMQSSPLCGARATTKRQRSVWVRAAERPGARSHAERGNEKLKALLLTVQLLFLVLSMTAPRASAADRPLALHPDNPHYFLFRGKP